MYVKSAIITDLCSNIFIRNEFLMKEILTKTDINLFYEQLMGQLQELQERVKEIKEENKQPVFDEQEATMRLCKENARRRNISLKSYIENQVIDNDVKTRYINLCKADEEQPNDFLIHEGGELFKISINKTADTTPCKLGFFSISKGKDY